jgi:ribonuclease III
MVDSKVDDNIFALCQRLKYQFTNGELIAQALTHKSHANENLDSGEDNQRLEFLGDAVIDLVVAEALMLRLPGAHEGELTPRRAALVNENRLAQIAREVELGSKLRLGRGEEQMNNGRDRSSILADAVEAVVGAVYLDGGYKAAQDVVLNWLGSNFFDVADGVAPGETKNILQELLQARGMQVPIYRVVAEEGPDHAKVFEVEIVVGEEVLAIGRGRSKKEAEKKAAGSALARLEELG